MGLFSAIFAIGAALGAVVKSAVRGVSQAVSAFFQDKVHRTMDQTVDVINVEIDSLRSDLRGTNDRIDELEQKLTRDGRLNGNQTDELSGLMLTRTDVIQRWGMAAAEQQEHQNATRQFRIDESRVHIVEGHVGLTNLQKVCRHCGLLMELRRNRKGATADLDSYFWSCPSFFDPSKHHTGGTASFALGDVALFANAEIEDWGTDKATLTRLTMLEEKHVIRRMSQHVNEDVDKIVCGFHGEPLRLHRNNSGNGILSLYSLRCKRPACEYKVAISSVGQLTTLLATTEGRGIL